VTPSSNVASSPISLCATPIAPLGVFVIYAPVSHFASKGERQFTRLVKSRTANSGTDPAKDNKGQEEEQGEEKVHRGDAEEEWKELGEEQEVQ